MRIEWTEQALSQWEQAMSLCREMFGNKTVENCNNLLVEKLQQLTENPELGHPEPLLKERKEKFRSLNLGKHYCLIYFVNTLCNTIYLIDYWDRRMNPTTLKRRVKS